MKAIKDLKDVQLAINEIYDFMDKYRSQNVDLQGRRFTNASPSRDQRDFVVREELNLVKDVLEKHRKDLDEHLRRIKTLESA